MFKGDPVDHNQSSITPVLADVLQLIDVLLWLCGLAVLPLRRITVEKVFIFFGVVGSAGGMWERKKG